jgi:hypothetical protein
LSQRSGALLINKRGQRGNREEVRAQGFTLGGEGHTVTIFYRQTEFKRID